MTKRVFGSIVSTLSGWVCGWICLVAIYFFGNRQYDYNHFSVVVSDDLGCFLLMAPFIIPVWLVVVMPLYLLIPREWLFWRWYFCTPVGAIVGVLTIQFFTAYCELCVYHTYLVRALDIVWPFDIPAAVVGTVTGLAGTLTYDYFHQKNLGTERR